MEELAQRRVGAHLAIAVLAAAALVPARAVPAWAEEGANIDQETGSPSPPAGSSTPQPVRVFTDARGRTCRVYERRVLIDGTPSKAFGTICREPSGRWVLSR
jgi:surface antigen